MSNLERFYEAEGFDVVDKVRRIKETDDVLISVSTDKAKEKTISIGVSVRALQISKMDFRKGDKRIKLVPIIHPELKRLYLVEDRTGYTLSVTNNAVDRIWFSSKPLYEKFVREYGFRGAVDGKLKFDEDLQAYYVEVN
jgi:hypothetical protein